ncbi:MAG: efflux RND transporter periplasmic adaptor subunit [Acidobacteria bacterium]|nr:efflux RND transporter periplasmic adaptor subunit [Acidobacteriota bacterium]
MRAATMVVVSGLVALGACARHEVPIERKTPVRVKSVAVMMAEEPWEVVAVGSLRSTREAVVSGKAMGTITEIRKAAGDRVTRGEVVVVVDSRDVAGQIQQATGALAQARAAAAIAETNFKRFEQLQGKGAASQLELDQARYQFDTARGAVTQAEGALATATSYQSYAEIPAPFDGRIVDRMCEVGDMASPGRPLLKIEDETRLRLDVTLAENDLQAARIGAAVRVHVPSIGDRVLEGKVGEIVPAADTATHSFLVKIDIASDPMLRSGQYGQAVFTAGTRHVLRVPKSAVRTRGGLTGVYVIEGDHATFRLITVSDSGGESVEALSGLSEGDRFVISSSGEIAEGVPIEEES